MPLSCPCPSSLLVLVKPILKQWSSLMETTVFWNLWQESQLHGTLSSLCLSDSSKMYVVFKFRRVPVPGCMHPKNDRGLDKAASCMLRGYACAACSQWELRCWLLCSKLCVLLSCSSWEPSLYNWFRILSLGYCRVKGDVLCPGMRTFRQGTEIILSSLWCWGPWVIEVEIILPCCWKQSSRSPAPPDFHCWHWRSCTLRGQLVIQMKTQNKRHC